MDTKQLAAMRREREIIREAPDQYVGRDGFMFVAYGCAVFERENDKGRIEYTATNLLNGKSEVIDRRNARVTYRSIDTLISKLYASRVSGLGRYEIGGDAPIALPKLRETVLAIFREILPNYDYAVRTEQVKLAVELLDAIAGRRVLLAEAAVGIGKTIVYMLVSVLIRRSHINDTWNGSYFPGMSCVEWQRMPTIISTSSIALQKAIVDDYLPAISKILVEQGIIRKPLSFVLRKGKEHYRCEHNLRRFLIDEKSPKIAAMLRKLIADENLIDLADVEGLTPHIKSKICVPGKCPKDCPFADECSYRAFLGDASNAGYDFQVTNHNLLLADARLRAEGNGQALPPYQLLIIDEAHKLLPAARSIYGAELAVDAIPESTAAVRELNFAAPNAAIPKELKRIRDGAIFLAEKLFALNKAVFGFEGLNADCDRPLRKLAQIAGLLQQTLKDCPKLPTAINERRKQGLVGELERVAKSANELADSESEIRWFERGDSEAPTALCGIPKALDKRLYADLWSRGIPTMLTSGTLSIGGDFTALKQSLGLNSRNLRLTEVTHGSPFNYKENCLLYLSENVPDYRDDNYIAALTDEIERLITASHGHAAVLFTSYHSMNVVHSRLKERLPDMKDFVLERGSSNAIERFKASGNGVLFACGSMWTGIDCPGDILSMLIIVKLPFAQPDAINEYERSKYPSFGAYLREVLTPEMLLTLRQGHGRGFRTECDTCVVAICDIRAAEGQPYYKDVINALPQCRVTRKIADIGDFYEATKPAEFFG
jgi:ATP-dependent DNA helicase DinG